MNLYIFENDFGEVQVIILLQWGHETIYIDNGNSLFSEKPEGC